MNRAHVHLLPGLVTADELSGDTVVVADILRATTTIIYALAAGAKEVVPLLSIEEALARKSILGDHAVLGGERSGKKIAGFDLGNSPAEYTPEAVGGRTVVFTTTNGTRAMQMCRGADRVLIGSFVGFSAVCRELAKSDRVHILCAGTDGQITREDVLFAGAVIEDLVATQKQLDLNDEAMIALDAWQSFSKSMRIISTPLTECLRKSLGGRNLIEIGMERDIEIAAEIDKFDLMGELDLKTWSIHK